MHHLLAVILSKVGFQDGRDAAGEVNIRLGVITVISCVCGRGWTGECRGAAVEKV